MFDYYVCFFFKQKTAYEMRISDGVQTCALPVFALADHPCQRHAGPGAAQRAYQRHDVGGVAERGQPQQADRGWSHRVGGGRNNGIGRHALVRLAGWPRRSEEHTSELQSLMRISYAVFCLKKKNITQPP